jgi:hypothetical protein
MRVVALLFALFAFIGAPLAANAPSYPTLLAKVKAGDTKIDYTALRLSYAVSDGYDGYAMASGDAKNAMIATFNRGDCKKALVHALAVIEAVYIDVDAHTVASRCYGKARDAAKSSFHGAVVSGLEASILASGDGKSEKTAFVAVLIDEEYNVLRLKKLRRASQKIVKGKDGRAYDVMQATDASGGKVTLYFQIDAILAGLDRNLNATTPR